MCTHEAVIRASMLNASQEEADQQVDAWKQAQRDEARDEIFKRATYEERFRRFGIPIPRPNKVQ